MLLQAMVVCGTSSSTMTATADGKTLGAAVGPEVGMAATARYATCGVKHACIVECIGATVKIHKLRAQWAVRQPPAG